MTIKEYISQQMESLGATPSDATLRDFSFLYGGSMDEEYTEERQQSVGKAFAAWIGELVLKPRQNSINENGFSVSFDYTNLGKYYLWLCRKWGVAADDDALALMGLSKITNKTKNW